MYMLRQTKNPRKYFACSFYSTFGNRTMVKERFDDPDMAEMSYFRYIRHSYTHILEDNKTMSTKTYLRTRRPVEIVKASEEDSFKTDAFYSSIDMEKLNQNALCVCLTEYDFKNINSIEIKDYLDSNLDNNVYLLTNYYLYDEKEVSKEFDEIVKICKDSGYEYHTSVGKLKCIRIDMDTFVLLKLKKNFKLFKRARTKKDVLETIKDIETRTRTKVVKYD